MKLISSPTNLFYSLPGRPRPFSLPHHSPSPPIPQPHSPSCISGFNTNPQRPDCAYNTPWIDKPLISSLSSLSKHPGFEGFFFSDLSLRSRSLPCGEAKPKAHIWRLVRGSRAALTGSNVEAWSSGNRALDMYRLGRRDEPQQLLMDVSLSRSYRGCSSCLAGFLCMWKFCSLLFLKVPGRVVMCRPQDIGRCKQEPWNERNGGQFSHNG